ncbi:helix-turn-helix domain-containing protein [Actinomadura sp. DC4]|uniref:helix-turn-helix domain-containing protein n=1 Tax=Actinomadura sp. DC4 TaxID=3055069 RepID=UPI0025AF78E0|nr:helix-turn-helix domain-containing protein [Actinomadura sp. DC4]MDN3358986.1 helix-turn-helix domain-containing protein [Actinomadura sp. DC4]
MVLILDAQQVRPRDRAEAIRETIWSSVVRVEIEHQRDPRRIAARGTISDVGRLNVCSVHSNATTVRRTPHLTHDDLPPSVFFGLQVSGSSMVVQGEREAMLRPGDIALYDTTLPYTLVNDSGIHQHFFRIAQNDLALPADALTELTALRLSRSDPVLDLASTYLQRMADHLMAANDCLATDLSEPTIELIRAAIMTRLPDPRLAREPLNGTLELRIMEYVRAHLAEHDLSATRIASEHHISVRHLYAILARAGISLGDWIREQRLEECRKELTKPGARETPIFSTAQRWGFVNAGHFSRVFKEAYGMSPREWRDRRRAEHQDD